MSSNVVATESVESVAAVDTLIETLTVQPTVNERLNALILSQVEHLKVFKDELATLKKLARDLDLQQKEHVRELKKLNEKVAKKTKTKKTAVAGGVVRPPNGINKPVILVTEQLYTFLKQFGVEPNTEIARTTVVKLICRYIKEHNLQNPEHKTEIIPDATLKALLTESTICRDKTQPESETNPKVYTYVTIQAFLGHHFPKPKKVVKAPKEEPKEEPVAQ